MKPSLAIVSAADPKYFSHLLRMIYSLQTFHPESKDKTYVIDLGLTGYERCMIEAVGPRVLRSERTKILEERELSKNFSDFLIHPILTEHGVKFEEVLWIDADTMICDKLDEAWSRDVDVVGHGDRGDTESGSEVVLTWEERLKFKLPENTFSFISQALPLMPKDTYFATGLWWTRSMLLLETLNMILDILPPLLADSPIFTAVVHNLSLSHHQLGSNHWNFSRDLVIEAEHVRNPAGGYIRWGEVRPKTMGFSNLGHGIRPPCPAADRFFWERVLWMPRKEGQDGE